MCQRQQPIFISASEIDDGGDGGLNVDESEGGDDDDDADDLTPSQHQLVLFLVSWLRGRDSGAEWMPFLNEMAGSDEGLLYVNARTDLGVIGSSGSLAAWTAALYGESAVESGCVDVSRNVHSASTAATTAKRGGGARSDAVRHRSIPTCTLPPEHDYYRGLVDTLSYEYGYAVYCVSEQADLLRAVLRNRVPVLEFSDETVDMTEHLLQETNLPQSDRRLIIVHFDGLRAVAESRGFDSLEYRAEVLCIDWQISRITKALWQWEPSSSTFGLCSDRGGVAYGEIDRKRVLTLEELEVPLALWGFGVPSKGVSVAKSSSKRGVLSSGGYVPSRFSEARGRTSANIVQFAPSLLRAIGVQLPQYWTHSAISSDLDPSADALVYSTYAKAFDTERYQPSVCPIPVTMRASALHGATYMFLMTLLIGLLGVSMLLYYYYLI